MFLYLMVPTMIPIVFDPSKSHVLEENNNVSPVKAISRVIWVFSSTLEGKKNV